MRGVPPGPGRRVLDDRRIPQKHAAGLSNAYAAFRAATGEILKTGSKLGEVAGGIKDGNLFQVKAIEKASSSIDEMNRSMKGISDIVERYLASAESSSSAIA